MADDDPRPNLDEEPDEDYPEPEEVITTAAPGWSMPIGSGTPYTASSGGPMYLTYTVGDIEPDREPDVEEEIGDGLTVEQNNRALALLTAKAVLGIEVTGSNPFNSQVGSLIRIAEYILHGPIHEQ